MTLISRVLGFARDVVFARFFGASAAFDAFVVALRIPNMLRRFFAEGSFSLAFVPVLAEYKERRDADSLKALVDAVVGSLAAVLLLIVGAGLLLAPWLVAGFAPGFRGDSAQFALATELLRITFPYALLISLVALAGGILNTHRRFALPAVTPVLLNVCLISAAFAGARWFDPPVLALAWAVLLAGLLQLLIQLPALAGLRLLPKPKLAWRHPGVVKIRRLMLPTLFGSSVAQVNILIDTLIASLIAQGAVSWLYYSDRLMEFPLGVFGIAIATVMLPSLSSRHSKGDTSGFAETIDWGLRLAVLIAVPAALGLIVLAGPIISTLFFHGAFSEQAARMSSVSLAAYAAGLPAFVLVKVLAPGFYSRQDTRTPVKIAVIAMLTNVVLNLAFVYVLTRWPVAGLPPHAGIALASSIAGYVNALLLYRGLATRKLLSTQGGWRRHLTVVLGGGLAMSLTVYWLAAGWGRWLSLNHLARVGELAVAIGAGAAVYLVVIVLGGVRIRALMAARH